MKALVIGGGIIGSSVAWRLASDGVQVSVFERGRLGLEASWMIATSFERIGSTAVQQLSGMIVDHVRHAVATGDWPTARFDGAATSDPDLQRTQLPAWQESVEGVVPTLTL